MHPIPRALLTFAVAATACGDDIPDAAIPDATFGDAGGDTGSAEPSPDLPTEALDAFGFAQGCFAIASDASWLSPGAAGFQFAAGTQQDAAALRLHPSDLGTYLLYDADGGYVLAEDGPLLRQTSLMSDAQSLDDAFISGAEWILQTSATDPTRYQLAHRKTGEFMGSDGLVAGESSALPLSFSPATGCREYPELTLDAEGEVTRTTFDDGTLYGLVDTHSHLFSNFAFGGGGIFHGAPFHRLGVEHALPDCTTFHGEGGRKDLFGFAFDSAGANSIDLAGLLPALLEGELPEHNHETAGYPEFTDWPNGPKRSTHQMQYYRWLERAHAAGLRLVVQHATTNSIICELTAGQGLQPTRYACDDMVAVDRILEETYALERYIDARHGGPGLGWFRIVTTPQQAREVIEDGRMAVVLGIETSHLFECTLVRRAGAPLCDETYVAEQLDRYYDMGVRALFPVHKYDNAFSAGDGDRAFIELGNFFNSGHFSNYTEDCPADIPAVFDHGDVTFGGLNQPRSDYAAPPPNDFSNFAAQPLGTVFPFLSQIQEPALVGDYCQNAGLTALGESLIEGMMERGMIIEIDHLPRRAYARMFEILEARDYPAVASHGSNFDGRLYALGGVSKTGLGRCREPGRRGAMVAHLAERVALIEANGGYPAEGFGFDLNGFAGAPGPRFGDGQCAAAQDDPITYPFESYAGDVSFTQPRVGNRELDFNTEGMVHIGLLPEFVEDARRDAVSDTDLEPLFRSAEGYIRMWERTEARAGSAG